MAARLFRQAVPMCLAAPTESKSGNVLRLARNLGIVVKAYKTCRMMDAVDYRCIERLESVVAGEVSGLLGGTLEPVCSDLTTLSFAGEREDGPPHRR